MASKWLEIERFGQSLWYDNLSRNFVVSGGLKKFISELGLKGITSNPSIFEKSISKGKDYDADIQRGIEEGLSIDDIYERLTTDDVRAAADELRGVYDATDAVDGYVSIEVDPRLANDTSGSIEAARRLWATIDRPNIMIKIPGTPAGIPAVEGLLTEGINVNITLLFGIENYTAVANAYLAAVRKRIGANESVKHLASVASFFLSRVDTNVDKKLEGLVAGSKNPAEQAELKSLMGKAANANAKIAYERFNELFHHESFEEFRTAGAGVQRCLWASVSTKNPAYSDVLYIEPLIGSETVTTVPDDTLAAFADHGHVANSLASGLTEAHNTIELLMKHGIDTEIVANELQADGVQKFIDSFELLSKNLESKRATIKEAIA